MRTFFILLLLTFSFRSTRAQVVKSVVLDSVVVEAVKQGFDVNDFINMVRSDTSFISAFRVLRNTSHEATGTMTIYGRKNKVIATRYIKARQITENNQRWMKIVEEKVTGNFYNRKEEPGTYTATLFDEIFFYSDTLPLVAPSAGTNAASIENKSNISKLKKLVFNPGSEISGVPVIGNRMAIFDDEMAAYYDYSIRVDSFNDSLPCYVFSCSEKVGAGGYPVVKYLNTWFDRKTFNIVYRDYRLKYSGLLFDFDVVMKISTSYKNEKLYPSNIFYSGFWDIPFRKKEKTEFVLDFDPEP